VLFIGVLVFATPAPAGASDARAEADFVSRINSVRQSHGVAPLAVYGELTGIARRWTDQMVGNGDISHNGNLSSEVSADWSKLGENVARGGTVDSVMNQFLGSSAHTKNILDPAYTHIGVGVSYDASGQLFTTHDFMAMNGAAPAAAPSAPTQRATRPAAPAPDPEPAPEPEPEPQPVLPPATPARMHTMLSALRAAEPPIAPPGLLASVGHG
jgi:hypothetical protein